MRTWAGVGIDLHLADVGAVGVSADPVGDVPNAFEDAPQIVRQIAERLGRPRHAGKVDAPAARHGEPACFVDHRLGGRL
jgi:hypothetical protein